MVTVPRTPAPYYYPLSKLVKFYLIAIQTAKKSTQKRLKFQVVQTVEMLLFSA